MVAAALGERENEQRSGAAADSKEKRTAISDRQCRPLLFVVEGMHRIRFLRRISRTLHAAEPALPDVAAWEEAGRLLFLPFGRGDVRDWTNRLVDPCACRNCTLYDAEAGVESGYRQRRQPPVNARPHCRAFLTGKRNLENYLTLVAIQDARHVRRFLGSR